MLTVTCISSEAYKPMFLGMFLHLIQETGTLEMFPRPNPRQWHQLSKVSEVNTSETYPLVTKQKFPKFVERLPPLLTLCLSILILM